MSTVSPALSDRLEAGYAAAGRSYLAATVLGGPGAAERADLSIFVAGATAGKRRVLPLIAHLGRSIYDFGERAAAANVVIRCTAMKDARLRIADTLRGARSWGAYQHYGDPYYRLIA